MLFGVQVCVFTAHNRSGPKKKRNFGSDFIIHCVISDTIIIQALFTFFTNKPGLEIKIISVASFFDPVLMFPMVYEGAPYLGQLRTKVKKFQMRVVYT